MASARVSRRAPSAEIENTLKPGSVSAYSKIARALDLPIDAVLPEIVD